MLKLINEIQINNKNIEQMKSSNKMYCLAPKKKNNIIKITFIFFSIITSYQFDNIYKSKLQVCQLELHKHCKYIQIPLQVNKQNRP